MMLRRRFLFAKRVQAITDIPTNEIWYTTTDNAVLTPTSTPTGLVSNVYSNGLGKMSFSSAVTSFPASMFSDKTKLETIYIPRSVTSVGNEAFANCSSLTAVYIYDLTAWCNISFAGYRSNPLYYAGDLYLNGEKVINLVVPDGITIIKAYAFRACESITSVVFPDSLITIDTLCFIDCVNLQEVVISDIVTAINNSAFERCSGMKKLTIGSNVSSIGYTALKGCTALAAIYCNRTTPPTAQNSTFTDVPALCVVYVPWSAVSAYQSASYWKNFTIQGYDF